MERWVGKELKEQDHTFCKRQRTKNPKLTKPKSWRSVKQSVQYSFKQWCKWLMALQCLQKVLKKSASCEWQWTRELICSVTYSVALITKPMIYFIAMISIHNEIISILQCVPQIWTYFLHVSYTIWNMSVNWGWHLAASFTGIDF